MYFIFYFCTIFCESASKFFAAIIHTLYYIGIIQPHTLKPLSLSIYF